MSTSGTATTSGTGTTSSSGTGPSATTSSGGPFSPANLPGLALWLNDGVGVIQDPQNAGMMQKWEDQSGNDNTAVAAPSSFAIDPAAVHGHDAYECAGSSELAINDAPSLQFGTSEYAIAMVFHEGVQGTSNGPRAMWYKAAPWFSYTSGMLVSFAQGADTIAVAELDTMKFHYAIMRGPHLRLLTDTGTTSGPTETNDVSAPGAPIWLCTGATQGQEIAEVIAVKGPLSDADTMNLQTYFQTKFNLP